MVHREEMLSTFTFHFRNIPQLLLITTCYILQDWYSPLVPLLLQFLVHLTVLSPFELLPI